MGENDKPKLDEATQKKLDLKKTFNRVFVSKDGAEILKYLENRYYIHRSIGFVDNTGLAYYEGQRSVVLAIKDLMDLEKAPPGQKDNSAENGGSK